MCLSQITYGEEHIEKDISLLVLALIPQPSNYIYIYVHMSYYMSVCMPMDRNIAYYDVFIL